MMISRTGYTGERGYEIFCQKKHVVEIWDQILDGGKDMGIRPVQFSTLDRLRTESYLLFFPGDNSETYPHENGDPAGDSLWELGLEFTVSPGKTGFIGAEDHYALEGRERFKIYGVELEGSIPHTAIQTEHRGLIARRMQCVHCKDITEDVEMDPFICAHCGLSLYVRDHYSRRIAAYQGVCVDAEDPGNIPEQKRIYG